MSNAEAAAEWMLEQVRKKGSLDQENAADHIRRQFRKDLIYVNDNGNQAISPQVLKAFKRISADLVIWERAAKMWRLRVKTDSPGRMQD